MIYDTTSDNPMIMIAQAQNKIRQKIQEHCLIQIMKYKWIHKLDIELALSHYLSNFKNQFEINKKTFLAEVKEEFRDLCDTWLLEALAYLDIDDEITRIFKKEWKLILGPTMLQLGKLYPTEH